MKNEWETQWKIVRLEDVGPFRWTRYQIQWIDSGKAVNGSRLYSDLRFCKTGATMLWNSLMKNIEKEILK